MKEIKFFNIKVHPLSRSEFLSIIKANLIVGNKLIQIGVNSASVNELIKNEPLRQAVNNADLVNIDGVSVVLALRFMGYKVPERVATPDLADDILKMAEEEGFSVFLLGARETTVIDCKKKLQKNYPELKLVGYRNGYYHPGDEPLIVEDINKSNPDILLIGMPSPSKELFFDNYGQQLNVKYILGVGGYFDIIAGLVRRAPKWVQNMGMEWFYRFIQEPRRMWRRYLLGNTRFFWLVLKEKFSKTMY